MIAKLEKSYAPHMKRTKHITLTLDGSNINETTTIFSHVLVGLSYKINCSDIVRVDRVCNTVVSDTQSNDFNQLYTFKAQGLVWLPSYRHVIRD